ncbi:polyprenyl glycosylphosphotransferase [Rhodococcoides trifolii]|uniref:Polyprenyl glycosylphosphotransferase n=1 Tax=Rhodococcoides trifolii TaxID=908250 RepID=A0A917G8C2_9NOCA|nr:sugar transferase [Rhodococcus trifolii]GGG27979.1 polyprenyl glycosylphosphotransferase [Rhodococcus trifolii]
MFFTKSAPTTPVRSALALATRTFEGSKPSRRVDIHVTPRTTPPRKRIAQRENWKRAYRHKLLATDTFIVFFAALFAQFARFGTATTEAWAGGAVGSNLTFSIIVALFWVALLTVAGSRDPGLIGHGADEYRRVVTATFWLFGGIAVLGLLLQAGFARSYLAIALPVGLIGLLAGRRFWRGRLAVARAHGNFTNDVVVIGSIDSVRSISTSFDRAADAGYRVVGACIPAHTGDVDAIRAGMRVIPVIGDETAIDAVMDMPSVTTVAVAAVEHLGYERMRDLAWTLDTHAVDLVVAPGFADVAGPRLKICPIDNLPLLQVDRPKRDGAANMGKTVFDMVSAAFALIMLSPVLLAAAIAIKLEDGGPVFFRQVRVGRGGRLFRIWKLRTMISGPANSATAAREDAGQAQSVFYKSANDARITRIGRFLRKTSIDELPQLLNVLQGDMSLVGPRPLLPGEGAQILNFIERRSLVKPGLTGLWQVSGRSDASEEERIRLDHYYVDNWSAVQDLVIIWRTVAAVLTSKGAY